MNNKLCHYTFYFPKDFTRKRTISFLEDDFVDIKNDLINLTNHIKLNGFNLSVLRITDENVCSNCIFNYPNDWKKEIDNAMLYCRLCKKVVNYRFCITKQIDTDNKKEYKYSHKLFLSFKMDESMKYVEQIIFENFKTEHFLLSKDIINEINYLSKKEILNKVLCYLRV